jgi:hypothetical protein
MPTRTDSATSPPAFVGSAFRQEDLERLALQCFGVNLDSLVGTAGSLDEKVVRFLEWVQTHNEWGRLIDGLRRERETHPLKEGLANSLAAYPQALHEVDRLREVLGVSSKTDPGFGSLAAMRDAHSQLLRDLPGDRIDESQLQRVRDFLSRGAATGAVLDSPQERDVAQGLLNYWTATLYTPGREAGDARGGRPAVPNALLADFDEGRAAQVSHAADAALDALSEDDREAARRVLLRLTRLVPEGREFTAVPARRAALESAYEPERVSRAVAALQGAGLLSVTPGATPADDQVGLRYEALIRTWGRLRKWLEQRLQFRDAAEFWERHGRDRGALLGGTLLAEAMRYRDLGPLEQEFVDASRVEADRLAAEQAQARQRQQALEQSEAEARRRELEQTRLRLRLWKWAVVVGGVLLVALLAVASYASYQRSRALEELDRAEKALTAENKALTEKVKAYEARDKAQREKDAADQAAQAADKAAQQAKAHALEQERLAAQTVRDAALISQQPPRAVGWKLWRPGQPLRVRFLGGDAAARDRVLRLAAEWSRHGNAPLVRSEAPDAEIRVAFRKGAGVWSLVGTDALEVPSGQPTMNYDLAEGATDDDWSWAVLMHFGFALGLIRENSSPFADIEWDENKVYDYYSRQYGWSRPVIRAQVLQKYPVEQFPWYRPFDPKSVMVFPVDPKLTLNNVSLGRNSALSESDKRFIAALYPPVAEPAPLPFGVRREGVCETFRRFHRFQFTLDRPTTVEFRVEIKQNSSFSLLRVQENRRPVELQTLTTPTDKDHTFRLPLEAGEYVAECYGSLPAVKVTPPFGAEWLKGGRPPGWDGRYAVRIEKVP